MPPLDGPDDDGCSDVDDTPEDEGIGDVFNCGSGPHDCFEGLCGCYDCRECSPESFCGECKEYREDCQCESDDDGYRDGDDGQPDEAQENNDFAHDDDPEPNEPAE